MFFWCQPQDLAVNGRCKWLDITQGEPRGQTGLQPSSYSGGGMHNHHSNDPVVCVSQSCEPI